MGAPRCGQKSSTAATLPSMPLKIAIFSLQMVRPSGLSPRASSSASEQATYQVFLMNTQVFLSMAGHAQQAVQQFRLLSQGVGVAGVHHGAMVEHHGAVADGQNGLRVLLDDDGR